MMNLGHKTSCVISDWQCGFFYLSPALTLCCKCLSHQTGYASVSGDASEAVRWAGLTNISSVQSFSAGKSTSQSVEYFLKRSFPALQKPLIWSWTRKNLYIKSRDTWLLLIIRAHVDISCIYQSPDVNWLCLNKTMKHGVDFTVFPPMLKI